MKTTRNRNSTFRRLFYADKPDGFVITPIGEQLSPYLLNPGEVDFAIDYLIAEANDLRELLKKRIREDDGKRFLIDR